jgi:hypothetical protein
MNRILLTLMISCSIIFSSCNELKTEDAISYNDFLVNSMDPLIDKMIDFEMAIYDDNTENLNEAYEVLLKTTTETEQAIISREAFDGNENFKKAAIDIISFYKSVVDKDYKEILSIIRNSEFNEEDEIRVEEILMLAYDKEGPYYEKFEKEAQEFAKKYSFEIKDTNFKK